MSRRVRLRLLLERIVAPPFLVLLVLAGFRPMGGGVRRG